MEFNSGFKGLNTRCPARLVRFESIVVLYIPFIHNYLYIIFYISLTFYNLLVTWCTNRFNIQQLYALSTLYLCVLYLSENKQRLVPLTV